jgi:hypothetical protein
MRDKTPELRGLARAIRPVKDNEASSQMRKPVHRRMMAQTADTGKTYPNRAESEAMTHASEIWPRRARRYLGTGKV